MTQSRNNQIKGKFHEVKGGLKETVGQVTKSPKLEAEGLAERLAGKVQKKVGDIEQALEK